MNPLAWSFGDLTSANIIVLLVPSVILASDSVAAAGMPGFSFGFTLI
jgi:hypothetical protein